jgi:predicted acylesterase/phospholipase RssA
VKSRSVRIVSVVRWTSAVVLPLMLASCVAPPRGPAVPPALEDRATVLNMPAIRTWGNALSEPFKEEMFRAARRELELRREAGETGPLPPAYFLAISGGGADGAFGAGLLCGWTAAGNRPDFKAVTGISTGALTAPFAYLGPRYDEQIRKVYTTVKTDQIADPRFVLAALFNDALMSTAPLARLMDQLVDEKMMRDIAAEYARGRLLLVGTTNLDAGRGVIWNIGAIAASGNPKALNLIHEILRASAAIPGAFPPVMIDVVVDGKHYQEMHVDGGTRAQVFLYPPSFELKSEAAAAGVQRDRIGYVIRNAKLSPGWADVRRRTLPIAARAISSLIQTQGFGDLFVIYMLCRRDGVDFNLAYIPATFQEEPKEDFDPVYMTKLFDVGFTAAKNGYPWAKKPPLLGAESVPAPAEPAVQESQPAHSP